MKYNTVTEDHSTAVKQQNKKNKIKNFTQVINS